MNSAAGAAGALAGWAISSLGKQLASTEIHSSLSVTSAGSLAPPSISSTRTSPVSTPDTSPRPSTDSGSFFSAPSVASTSKPSIGGVRKAVPAVRATTQGAGLKLGVAKSRDTNGSSLVDTLAGEWEDADDVANAWGTKDLIDVNADDDDWAGFESAPVSEVVVPPPQSYYVSPSLSNGHSASSKISPNPSPPKKSPIPSITSTFSKPVSGSPLVSVSPPVAKVHKLDGWGDAEEVLSDQPVPSKDTTNAPSLAGMDKAEKDKEMARRREERKAVSPLAIIRSLIFR